MSFQRRILFCFLAFVNLCGCSCQKEILHSSSSETEHFQGGMGRIPYGFECIAELCALGQNSLGSHLMKIADDFKKKGKLYETWKQDGDSISLRFSWRGQDYSVQETLELVCETLREALKKNESLLFVSPLFERHINQGVWISKDGDYEISKHDDLFFRIYGSMRHCISISIAIDGEFISIMELLYSFSERICIYDFISHSRYYMCKHTLITHLERVAIEQLSRGDVLQIIDILKKCLVDIDIALDCYIFSERAIVANIVASILKKEKEIYEAEKTIRYLDTIVRKRAETRGTTHKESEKWFLDAGITRTEPPEFEVNSSEMLKKLVGIRKRFVPSKVETTEQLKFKIDTLIDKYSGTLPPENIGM